jgi:ParB/RepB/Spo0J family partition protein
MANEKSGLASVSQGRSDIHKIDPRVILTRPGWNGRDFSDPENVEHIEKLARSIAKVGVKEPITCYWENGNAYLSDGECRLRAALLAISKGHDIKSIPVKAEDRYQNEADRIFSQVLRNSGKPFSPMEQAKVFKRLLDLGWEQTEISEKSGISISRVGQVLSLLCLPEPIRQMVSAGEVSASLAQKVTAEANTDKEAVQTLQVGITAAKKQGKKRVTPKHLNGASKDDGGIQFIEGVPYSQDEVDNDDDTDHHKTRHRNPGIEKTVFEAFEHAEVDDECVDDKGRSVVVITMPADQWELIRQALKL